jgi:hypothetical protein
MAKIRTTLTALPVLGAIALGGCQMMPQDGEMAEKGQTAPEMAAERCADAPVPGNRMAAISAPDGYEVFTKRLSGFWYTGDGKQAVCGAVLVTDFDAEAGTAQLVYGHGKKPAWGYQEAGHSGTIPALLIEDNGLLFRDPATNATITLKPGDGRVTAHNVTRDIHAAFVSDPRF